MTDLAGLKQRVDETINLADERRYFGASVKYQQALEAEVERLRADPRLTLTPSDLTLLLNAAWETCQRDDAKGEPHVPTAAAVARLRAAAAAMGGEP